MSPSFPKGVRYRSQPTVETSLSGRPWPVKGAHRAVSKGARLVGKAQVHKPVQEHLEPLTSRKKTSLVLPRLQPTREGAKRAQSGDELHVDDVPGQKGPKVTRRRRVSLEQRLYSRAETEGVTEGFEPATPCAN